MDGMESTLPPPSFPSTSTAPVDLRKTGIETPMSVPPPPPKQLYTVIEQKQAGAAAGSSAVFASEIAYAVPTTAAAVPEGAESVLSKAMPAKETKRKSKEDDDDEDLGKFKF